MIRLLIIADDFTGALDTGVKFSAAGASTKIITDVHTNFTGDGPEVLVLCVPTRHLSPREAYEAVRPVVERAAAAGIACILKKQIPPCGEMWARSWRPRWTAAASRSCASFRHCPR